MSCGGCKERGEAIKRAFSGGDVKREVAFVRQSFAEDAQKLIAKVVGKRPELLKRTKKEIDK